jgi:hypothetical protein
MAHLADGSEVQRFNSSSVSFDISTVTIVTSVMLEPSPCNLHGASYHDSMLRTYLVSG